MGRRMLRAAAGRRRPCSSLEGRQDTRACVMIRAAAQARLYRLRPGAGSDRAVYAFLPPTFPPAAGVREATSSVRTRGESETTVERTRAEAAVSAAPTHSLPALSRRAFPLGREGRAEGGNATPRTSGDLSPPHPHNPTPPPDVLRGREGWRATRHRAQLRRGLLPRGRDGRRAAHPRAMSAAGAGDSLQQPSLSLVAPALSPCVFARRSLRVCGAGAELR